MYTPDPPLVAAARRGDRRALDALVQQSMPLVYNIVARSLGGRPDVDDVVQETLLRVVRHLGELRDPAAYRSWLVAIAVRQVRDAAQSSRAAERRTAGLEDAQDVADPAASFDELTALRMGLAEQRREVAQASRWLDPEDRTLLTLWWLEEIGEVDRAGLAGAIGVGTKHAAVRVQRMKEQVEVSRSVVRALGRPGCAGLAETAHGWDGQPSPLWRKRFARHVRGCAECSRERSGLPVDRIVTTVPVLAVPASLLAARAVPHAAVVRPRGLRVLTGKTALIPAAGVTTLAVAVALVVAQLSPGAAAPTPMAQPSVSTAVSASPPVTVAPSPSASVSPSASKKAVLKPPPATSAKKGVAVWNFGGVSQALASSGASWYYTWNTRHDGVSTPAKAAFVPMIWGAGSVTASALADARKAGPYLLGFNEPDMSGQANMSTDQALSLWPQLMATGSKLGSPAVAWGGADAGGWLDRFMSGAAAKGYRVDFIALHWYGGDFRTANAVSQLKSYLTAVWNRYHKPIWLTEFALIDFSNGTRFPAQADQAAFVTAAFQMLGGLSFLQRYAWFGLPASDKDQSGLFRSGTDITTVGRAYVAAK
ncbi:sigma-70 family RNA polymerase sigma factor [Hamadaea tsunoensis]|uniref:sigma-70 family RNA polymerase sigma factor n=1 Tax=Hamadaea tsunoensis TaxID=53368 RepID=UPI0003F6A1E2|nr:sigma-70 family RNA polymerase sigma factor [Hamadaea tsunoensis]